MTRRRLPILPIVRAYPGLLVRIYCLLRFRIIRTRFIDEMAQYLPAEGRVVEVGCGFGLFTNNFSRLRPDLELTGIDRDEGRIALAERARRSLGLDNVTFRVGDARDALVTDAVDGVYLLDLLHHIPPAAVRALVQDIHQHLPSGGVMLVKDIDTRPRLKMAFTWTLDVLMTRGERPDYWSTRDMTAMVREVGFDVVHHALVDVLPYSHVLYVCTRRADTSAKG